MNIPRITHYQRCNCGAITIWFESDDEVCHDNCGNSMYQDTFDKLGLSLEGAEEMPQSYCCNHCVNHYGIDLCECGSGERVGECECGSHEPREFLGVGFDSFAEVCKAFGL